MHQTADRECISKGVIDTRCLTVYNWYYTHCVLVSYALVANQRETRLGTVLTFTVSAKSRSERYGHFVDY